MSATFPPDFSTMLNLFLFFFLTFLLSLYLDIESKFEYEHSALVEFLHEHFYVKN